MTSSGQAGSRSLSTAVTKSSPKPAPQITVLDTGGQYTHLIARKVRELGVYADVQPSDTPLEQLSGRRGFIISGGPASVYEPNSPKIDPRLLRIGSPVLGICYGHQLIAQELGGAVVKGSLGEYGIARLQITGDDPLFSELGQAGQIWMSHSDSVAAVPSGFRVIATTETSDIAAMADAKRRIYGLQFHPEVVHTHAGTAILRNFVQHICGATSDWDLTHRVEAVEDEIGEIAGDRSVFFFVSGGVDSTVAYALCLRALGPERVHGLYVDTGLMRLGETEFVRAAFKQLGARRFSIENAETQFLSALAGITDPEQKRRAIGEQFVRLQQRILSTGEFLDGRWILGQGTIYPDTIESGGTSKADVIKTHHNRVPGIQALIERGLIVEPLTSFYKDEVRAIGREIGVPEQLLTRHPFPGPGLAIRCLCSNREARVSKHGDHWLLPVLSVGVQGDSRTYRQVLALAALPSPELARNTAPALTNADRSINRVVSLCGTRAPLDSLVLSAATITRQRLDLLRRADELVRNFAAATQFDARVWQFPVVQIPLGSADRPESLVLRPVQSVDGMTADAVVMEQPDLRKLTEQLLELPAVAAVFYDLTHKPPGTIEWE